MEDRTLRNLGFARSALGIAVTLVVGYIYRKNQGLFSTISIQVSGQFVASEFSTYVYGGLCLLAGIGLLACWQRSVRGRHLLIPLYTYGLALVAIFGPIYALAAFFFSLPSHVTGPLSSLALLVIAAIIFGFPWWSAYLYFCIFYLSRDVFRAADTNPLLAPVLSTAIPLAAFILKWSGPKGGGDAPGWVGTIMSVSGIVSTGILAAVEIYRLRHDHGVTFRDVPPAGGRQRAEETADAGAEGIAGAGAEEAAGAGAEEAAD